MLHQNIAGYNNVCSYNGKSKRATIERYIVGIWKMVNDVNY
jgi:hypothetical protein